ncbi:MAG TPA: hypothetical protein VFJ72_05880 [Rubrobacteraceae bacterium]|nr:hypothetical protein [Rubrobacteraceae bacterium]
MVSKTHNLRWLESLKESQKITAREERRKDEILAIYQRLHRISSRRLDPPVFPPWRTHW